MSRVKDTRIFEVGRAPIPTIVEAIDYFGKLTRNHKDAPAPDVEVCIPGVTRYMTTVLDPVFRDFVVYVINANYPMSLTIRSYTR